MISFARRMLLRVPPIRDLANKFHELRTASNELRVTSDELRATSNELRAASKTLDQRFTTAFADVSARIAALESRIGSLDGAVAERLSALERRVGAADLNAAQTSIALGDRLVFRKLDPLPVPHLISDNALTPEEIAACNRHWPSFLPEESPGYRVLHLKNDGHTKDFDVTQRAFWSAFIQWPVLPLVKELYCIYFPWIFRKFGDRIESIQPTTIALTECDGHHVEIGSHVHRHDPTWLFTVLIHIDDGENERADDRGNAVFGFENFTKAQDYSDRILSKLSATSPGKGVEGLDIRRCYSFKPGRLFSFFETPVSYHGSRPSRPDLKASGRRRMLRMHVSAPFELANELYGVSVDEFRKLQYPSGGITDPRVKLWMRRDVDAMFEATASPLAYNSRSMQAVNVLAPASH